MEVEPVEGEPLGRVIVLNTGSRTCRIGFAGEQVPKYVFPSIVGRPTGFFDGVQKEHSVPSAPSHVPSEVPIPTVPSVASMSTQPPAGIVQNARLTFSGSEGVAEESVLEAVQEQENAPPPEVGANNKAAEQEDDEGRVDFLVGDAAKQERHNMSYTSPMKDGLITNWEDLEKVWAHAFFDQMAVDVEQHPVLLAEPPMNPKSARQRMTQIMFDTFGVPSLFITNQCVLTMRAAGRSTGIVVDCGAGMTNTVPVVNDFLVPGAFLGIPLAGRKVTEYLESLLRDRGLSFVINPILGELGAEAVGLAIAVVEEKTEGSESSPWVRVQRHFHAAKINTGNKTALPRARPSATKAAPAGGLEARTSRLVPPTTVHPVSRLSVPAPAVSRLSVSAQRRVSGRGLPDEPIATAKAAQMSERDKKNTVARVVFEEMTNLKEAHCYVAQDFVEESGQAKKKEDLAVSFKLPGGVEFSMAAERFQAPEVLFQPVLLGQEHRGLGGIHLAVLHAIWNSDADLRPEMFANIVLAGGTSKLPGIAERLEKELRTLAPRFEHINVIRPDNEYTTWIGGSKMATEMDPQLFRLACLSKEEYDEKGPTLASVKFI